MDFEFDPAKSAANLEKHGIDFKAAQALWDDPRLLEAPARTEGEQRYLVIGTIDGTYWSAICTSRDGRIRLISVRRSRKMEIEHYEND